jgi:DNA-binding response OmpR family regulator
LNDRILLIDDDPSVHDVVRAYLEHDGYIVHSSFGGREGIALSHKHSAALVIVDQVLPDLPGTEVLQEIRRRSDVPIIMVSGQAGVEERITALGAGADDYVTKPFSPRELAAHVKAVLRRAGAKGAGEDVLRFADGVLEIDRVRHEVRVRGRPCGLTVTEYDIVETLAEHPGRVYSRTEITYHCRGHEFEGYERTIDAHVKNFRRKIDALGPPLPVIETVRGVGYRLGLERS